MNPDGHVDLALRAYQEEVVEFVTSALNSEGHAAIEAPTGSGKTLMSLVSAIRNRKDGQKILYLTRTNSQQEQVMADLRRLPESMRIRAVAMQGRSNLCLLYREHESRKDFSPESLSRFCGRRKRGVMMGNPEACRFFNMKIREKEFRDFLFTSYPTAEETMKYASENGMCPYEGIKYHLKTADLVVAPYAYYLNRNIADRLLYNMGTGRNNLIIILDECHNVPDLARNFAGFKITVDSMNRAEKEALDFGDPEIDQRVRISDLIEMARGAIVSMASELGEEEDRRIMFRDFLEQIMIANHLNSAKISSYFLNLAIAGEEIEEKMELDGRVPRSRVLSVASRLISWENADESQFAAIVSREEGGSLQAVCMDPSETLDPLRESRTIHFSGTIEPFRIYSRMTGFNNMKRLAVKNVFPRDRRLFVYDESISSRYEEVNRQTVQAMRDKISDLVTKVGRRTMIFFPSYSLMEKVLRLGFEFTHTAEEKGSTQEEVMELVSEFRTRGFPLFAVSGGRLSEGMNFPGSQLEMVILAGIPYPRPDARNRAISDYYDRVYGRGWEYSVTFPTSVRVRQILGRLIRSEADVGAGVILDRRASNFSSYIEGLYPAEDVTRECVNFFSRFGGP